MNTNSNPNTPTQFGRILLVTSNFPRWANDSTTPFVFHLARDLQKLGWRIDVLAPHAKGTAVREIMDGVRVERFRYMWPSALETVCYQGGALINLRERKSNYFKLPALVASEWFAIAKRLIHGKYDLLNSHWILPQGFTGTLAARPLGVPHVITVHGSDIFALRSRLITPFKRFALKKADTVTVNSSATEKAVKEIVPNIKKLYRIPMGVSVKSSPPSPSPIELREQYRRGQGPLLIFVGRVVKEKGVEDLIRAMALLVPHFPDVSALIVGEGQDRPELEVLAKSLGLTDCIIFCGWISPELVPNYLSAGDIFIGPSWIEAQGLSIIEAMLAQTPVIASRVGGIVDIVEDKITGLLVNKCAPAEIAEAIEKIIYDPELAQRIRTNGRKKAETEFSREASAIAFSELFLRTIQESKRR